VYWNNYVFVRNVSTQLYINLDFPSGKMFTLTRVRISMIK